jgi:catalase
MRTSLFLLGLAGLSRAACPYMDGDGGLKARDEAHAARDRHDFETDADFLKQFALDDSNAYLTSDAGGPIQDSKSLKAGIRGPTLLEDFIFRQKIQHFDHERVCVGAWSGMRSCDDG